MAEFSVTECRLSGENSVLGWCFKKYKNFTAKRKLNLIPFPLKRLNIYSIKLPKIFNKYERVRRIKYHKYVKSPTISNY